MARVFIDIDPDALPYCDLSFKYQVVCEAETQTLDDGSKEDVDVFALYQSFGLRCRKVKVWSEFEEMTKELFTEIENAEWHEFK